MTCTCPASKSVIAGAGLPGLIFVGLLGWWRRR
jgi:hypothetical protein